MKTIIGYIVWSGEERLGAKGFYRTLSAANAIRNTAIKRGVSAKTVPCYVNSNDIK